MTGIDLHAVYVPLGTCYLTENVMKTDRNKCLKDFMSQKQLKAMKGLPTYHSNCLKLTGVARPGKTARDRAKKSSE